MKVVDKYELALMGNGTPFYELDEYGNIDSGLCVLDGFRFKSNNETYFNGVTYLEPESKEDTYGLFKKGELPKEFELFSVDTDSNDYEDNDRFLVLEPNELLAIIKHLKEYYEMIKEK